MKHLYTFLLTCGAVALSSAAVAQHTSKTGQPLRSAHETVRPGGHTIDLRGGGPANDECTGAVNQNLAVGGSVTFTGDNTGATDSDSLGYGHVWETFTTTECANLELTYCGTSPSFGNAYLALFIDCPFTDFVPSSSFDVTTCPDGNVTIFYEGVPAGQYYYAVMNDPDNGAVGAYSITVSASACPAGPSNDECDGAISLTSGTSCVGTPFTTTGATQSLAPILCEGFTSSNAFDVWFSFVCTNSSQTIGVVGFNEADAMVELFTGPCADLTSLACADATFPQTAGETTTEQLIQTGLNVGTTYWVRVYDWGHGSPEHNFEICVTEGEGTNIGIEEAATADWSVYPNPGSGVFNLQYSGANGLANIEVFDVTGRIVYNHQMQVANGTTRSMDLTGLTSGNYNVRLTVGGVRTEQRLMVK